jgi:hypothetical protein
MVQGQPRQKVRGLGQKSGRLPSQPITGHSDVYLSSQAVREDNIRRIEVPDQPRQNKFEKSHLSGKKLGMMAHA